LLNFAITLSKMKDTLSLDDLLLFLAVCDAGGLAGAVQPTGQSAPTLSRKMAAVERQTGRRLFMRGRDGYSLTAEGRELRREAESLSEARTRLATWSGLGREVRVRITAGTWTSHWLAQNLGSFWRRGTGWVPEFLASNANLDIARREADIGLRNRRPEQTWLAGRRLRRIEYAEYGVGAHVDGYVTLADHVATTPSTRWVHNNRTEAIVTTVSNARLELDLAREGIARVILPVFIGGREANLTRLSGPIEELTHDEWLVTHHDARHDTPVRQAIAALTGFIEATK